MILLRLCIASLCLSPHPVQHIAWQNGQAFYDQMVCDGHVQFTFDGTATIAADRCEGFIFRNSFGD